MFLDADSDIIVQSGIKWEEVNRILAEKKIPLFFPVSQKVFNARFSKYYLNFIAAGPWSRCYHWWNDCDRMLRESVTCSHLYRIKVDPPQRML